MTDLLELKQRYERMCDFKNGCDDTFIENKIRENYARLGLKEPKFLKCESFRDVRAVRDARAARATWAAWDTWDARDTWAARDARAARAAWAAWDTWDARDTWAARAVRAAWAARDARAARAGWAAARDAWDASYSSAICLGAAEKKDDKVLSDWLPIFEAAEKGLWFYYYFDDVCVWVPQPSLIKTENKKLHCADSHAFELSKEKLYFWRGTLVSKKLILTPNQITSEDILSEKNSEVSRAIAEKLGWDEYMKRIGTVLVDKWFDPSKSLHYELYDFKERRFSLMPRLLKMESPELNDGTRPYYIEPVDPQLKTCKAARRWQFLKMDGSWPSVGECNEKPDLVFEREA